MSILITSIVALGITVGIHNMQERSEKKTIRSVKEEFNYLKFIESKKFIMDRIGKTEYEIKTTNNEKTILRMNMVETKTLYELIIEGEIKLNILLDRKEAKIVVKKSKLKQKEVENQFIEFIEKEKWREYIDFKEVIIKEKKYHIGEVITANQLLKEKLSALDIDVNKIKIDDMSIKEKHNFESKIDTINEVIENCNVLEGDDRKEIEDELIKIVELFLEDIRKREYENLKGKKEKAKEALDFFKKID